MRDNSHQLVGAAAAARLSVSVAGVVFSLGRALFTCSATSWPMGGGGGRSFKAGSFAACDSQFTGARTE